MGMTGEPVDAVCIAPAIEGVVEPASSLESHYSSRHAAFRRLYERLKPSFSENA
jgi:hypothetical protein